MKAISFLSILLLVFSCGNNHSSDAEYMADMAAPMEEVVLEEIAMEDNFKVSQTSQRLANKSEEIQKKVVKTANLSYKVGNSNEEYDRLKRLLPKHDAYVSSENENKGYDRINYSMTIKVVPLQFDSLVDAITSGQTLDSKWINSDDVTARYYDLQSRIENKQKLEERYQEILKKAESVKDMLEVERNLNMVRGEIEALQGQFKLLNHQVNFSTIDLTFYELLPYEYDGQQRPGFGKRIANAFSGGWNGFLSFLVFTVRLWPFVFLTIGIVVLIKRVRQGRKKSDL